MEIGSCAAARPAEDNDDPEQFLINQLDSLGRLSTQKAFEDASIDSTLSMQNDQLMATIFPNPNKGNFKIVLNKTGDYTVTVLNIFGQIIFQRQYAETGDINIALKNQAAGEYYIKIANSIEQLAAKILVQ